MTRRSLVLRGVACAALLAVLCPATALAAPSGASGREPAQAAVGSTSASGWREEADGWHYYDDGEELTGWHELPTRDDPGVTSRYHFDDRTGAMDTLSLIDDGEDGVRFVEEDGRMAAGKEVYDPASDAWYWADSVEVNDGRIAMGKDVYLPSNGGKWVRYDAEGRMVKGQDGAVSPDDGQWHWWYFDPVTGEMLSHDEVVARLLAVAASQDGQTSGDGYEAALASVGKERNPNGPCMTYVWWCFHEAGMDFQFMDGQATSWPHEVALWYEASGRLMHDDPQPGDIWLIYQNGAGPAPATHAGLVASHPYYIDGEKYVDVWEFVNGWVHLQRENCVWYEGHLYGGSITGFGRPLYND